MFYHSAPNAYLSSIHLASIPVLASHSFVLALCRYCISPLYLQIHLFPPTPNVLYLTSLLPIISSASHRYVLPLYPFCTSPFYPLIHLLPHSLYTMSYTSNPSWYLPFLLPPAYPPTPPSVLPPYLSLTPLLGPCHPTRPATMLSTQRGSHSLPHESPLLADCSLHCCHPSAALLLSWRAPDCSVSSREGFFAHGRHITVHRRH